MLFGKSNTVGLCSLANFINAADRAIMPSKTVFDFYEY
jgi:hypothetical protein